MHHNVTWKVDEVERLLHQQLSIREDLIVEEIDGECLVLDMERNVYFGLDTIGLFIWRQIESGLVGEDVVELLVEEYGEALRGQVEQDTRDFLRSLYAARLVVDSEAT